MEQTVNYEEDSKRECHGRTMAISQMVDKVSEHSTGELFYLVESETLNEVYYFVRYKYGTNQDSEWCSCNDFTNRAIKCKHLYAVQYATRLGIFKDTPKNGNKFQLKKEIQGQQQEEEQSEDLQVPPKQMTLTVTDNRNNKTHSWLDDNYDF